MGGQRRSVGEMRHFWEAQNQASYCDGYDNPELSLRRQGDLPFQVAVAIAVP